MENGVIIENTAQNDIINSEEYKNIINDTKISIKKQKISLHYIEKKGSCFYNPNWPTFFPIFHYDISEVSFQYRHLLNKAYFCWKSFLIVLIMNSICCILTMNAPKLINIYEPNLFISILYVIILPLISFDMVNISIFEMILIPYDKIIKRKTLFLIFLNCFLIFFLALGIRYSGSNGIIMLIDLCLEDKWIASFFSCIITFSFLSVFLLYFQLFTSVLFEYTESTHLDLNERNTNQSS